MNINRKQRFMQRTASESQAQKYYYKRIRIGVGVICIIYVLSCVVAVFLGLKGANNDLEKLNNHTTFYTDEFLMKTSWGTESSSASFSKYDLPVFITRYAYKQTQSLVPGNFHMRVSPCAALFDSKKNFVSSNLWVVLYFNKPVKKEASSDQLELNQMMSAPIPFQTEREREEFTNEINAAINAGSNVSVEGYVNEQLLKPFLTVDESYAPRYGQPPVLYATLITMKQKDGSQKSIKITMNYDLPTGTQKGVYSCLYAVTDPPLNTEAATDSSKYLNKSTISNYDSVAKELKKKSNIWKSYYLCVEKITLTPLGHFGMCNLSEQYAFTPNYPVNSYAYYDSKSLKELKNEEYYVVSYGTYSPLTLAIAQVETYSSVNFMNMTLLLFAAILLLTVAMLILLKKRLRQIEQNRKDLIMSIAHEMKTPFGIVRLYGEKILITPDPQGKEECAADMMDEIDEMNSLLQNILDASRLDSGSLKLNKSVFNMNEAAQDVMEGYSPLAEDKNIQMELNANGDFSVNADNYRIKQVISNLLSNAIKNTPENGKITITIHKDGKNTAVTVKNTGKPIPKEKISRIWEAFYKHTEDTDNAKKGAGLGLSIVKNIVALHGGHYGVENIADGVKFWFCI